MSREGDEPDDSPPRSLVDPNEYRSTVSNRDGDLLYSPAPRSQKSDALLELANSTMSYTNRNANDPQLPREVDEDVASDIQERSEAGDTILPVVNSHVCFIATRVFLTTLI